MSYSQKYFTPDTCFVMDGENVRKCFERIEMPVWEVNWRRIVEDKSGSRDINKTSVKWHRAEKIEHHRLTPERLLNYIYKGEKVPVYKEKLRENRLPSAVKNELDYKMQGAQNWLESEKERFNIMENEYDHLANVYKELNIEVCKEGVLKLDPYRQKRLGEKGVDMATGLSIVEAAEKGAKRIVLFSGDSDMIPAIKRAQLKGAKVFILGVWSAKKNVFSVSQSLINQSDGVILLKESELRTVYRRNHVKNYQNTKSVYREMKGRVKKRKGRSFGGGDATVPSVAA